MTHKNYKLVICVISRSLSLPLHRCFEVRWFFLLFSSTLIVACRALSGISNHYIMTQNYIVYAYAMKRECVPEFLSVDLRKNYGFLIVFLLSLAQ